MSNKKHITGYKLKAFLKNGLGESVYEYMRKFKRTFPFLIHPVLYYYKAKEFYKVYEKDTIFFVGTPPHGNIGDSAIAEATVAFLKAVGYKHIYEVPCPDYYLVKRLMKRHGKENLICFHGGGNMGEIYFANEVLRRDVIRSFPDNRIILMPQTVDYSENDRGRKELQKSIKIYGEHKRLTIFAREKISYERMKQYYPHNSVYLVPDIVLSWKLDFPEEILRKDILFCLRKDAESKYGLDKRQHFYRMVKNYFDNIVETDTWIPGNIMPSDRNELVIQKLLEFKRAYLVITDRLHGMIFAAITGTPCIVIPNSNHKVESEYEWLKELEYIKLLQDPGRLENTIEYFKENICPHTYAAYCPDDKFELLVKVLQCI